MKLRFCNRALQTHNFGKTNAHKFSKLNLPHLLIKIYNSRYDVMKTKEMITQIIDTKDAYDHLGKIKCMTHFKGYVMVRRPLCSPFVMHQKEWGKLPKDPVAGATWFIGSGSKAQMVPPLIELETDHER